MADLLGGSMKSSSLRSVPLSSFVQPRVEDDFGRIPALSVNVSGKESMRKVVELDSLIKELDDLIAKVYPMRSSTRGLSEALKGKNSEKIADVAKQMLQQIESVVNEIIRCGNNTIRYIAGIFANYEFWDKNLYSSLVIDRVCLALFRLFTLGRLCPVKNALADDISILSRMIGPRGSVEEMESRMWRTTPNFSKSVLLMELKKIDPEHVEKIFGVFWWRIVKMFEPGSTIIYPDMETAYLVTLLFMIDFYVQAKGQHLHESVWKFVENQRSKNPALFLCFEYAVDFDDMITHTQLKPKIGKAAASPVVLRELVSAMKHSANMFANWLGKIRVRPSEEQMKGFVAFLPGMFRRMAFSIHSLKRLRQEKYDERGKSNSSDRHVSRYERTMRENIEDEEKEQIMQILMIVRSLRESIMAELPCISEVVGAYIDRHVQTFITKKLPEVIGRSKQAKDRMEADILELTTAMKWENDRAEPGFFATPHISLLELLRVQLDIFSNPDNPSRPGKSVTKKQYTDLISVFLEESTHYVDLLRLSSTVDIVSDQSDLFFKEIFLDIYRSEVMKPVYFPVTASLPYVLIDYVLRHSDRQELMGCLFYPLSIYDDAAATAVKRMRSRWLFGEVRAEADICLMTIAQMIASFVFEHVKGVCQDRLLEQYDANLLAKVQVTRGWDLRVVGILQDNEVFLLGQKVNTKELFIDKLNDLLIHAIEKTMRVLERYGVIAMVAVSKLLESLKEVHKVLTSNGLHLIEFQNMVNSVTKGGSVHSPQSAILDSITANLRERIIPAYFLHAYPHRLVPPPHAGQITDYAKRLGLTIPAQLLDSMEFVSTESFREVLRWVDDSAFFVLAEQLKSLVSEYFVEFLDIYKDVKESITRIPDPPLRKGCHQAYDLFEGIYLSFAEDEQIDALFGKMKALGNALAVAEMIDVAFSMKRVASYQARSFIMMTTAEHIGKPGFFDSQFKQEMETFQSLEKIPSRLDILLPCVNDIVASLSGLVSEHQSEFAEMSSNPLKFDTLRGFAAIWSILEFVFLLKEIHRGERPGPFARFGDGVFLFVGMLLCLTGQQSLSRVLSIGNKIQRQRRTDLVVIEDATLTQFLSFHNLIKTSLELAISSFIPVVKSLGKRV